MEQTRKKSTAKKIIIWVLAVVLVFSAVSMIAIKLIFNDTFSRGELSPYSSTLRYADVEDSYTRSPREFYSGENKLQGYVYGEDGGRGLVVVSHGIGGGHENYMTEICWFVDNGWQVFAFDNTGSCESEGKNVVGLVQSAIDLDAALTYIESDPGLSGRDIFLFGHSWGGYGVTAVLNFGHDITAVASLAGYNRPVDIAVEWGRNSMGVFAELERPFVWLNNKLIFGSLSDMTAVEGINSADTPVLIIHGTGDETVRPDGAGIVAHRDEITNPNVRYFVMDKEGVNGHNTIMFSPASAEYVDEIQKEYEALAEEYGGRKNIPESAEAELFAGVDKARANEANSELMDAISDFYTEAAAGQLSADRAA